MRYFENNQNDIRDCFTFKDIHLDVAMQYFYSAFSNEDVISLHIRRGDYQLWSHHPIQTLEYYEKSLKFFNRNLKVIIFSDDIDWAQEQEMFKSERFFFSRNNNAAVDLCMQSLCKYHIISNSSFSWWGAWLANSKKVVRPTCWFGPPLEHYENFLNVDGWIKISNKNNDSSYEKKKLKNFPSVNFISIEESQYRRDILYENFQKYEIQKIIPHIYKKYKDGDDKIIEGKIINLTGKGPVTSHLKTIKYWYENTDEEYTFICEDDLSFDSVQYWNFTWDEFFNSLPKDWNIIQLCLVRDNVFQFYNPEVVIKRRCWCDWSACAYLISRKHAENLIKTYYADDYITLDYKGNDLESRQNEKHSFFFLIPHAENLIYSDFNGGIYNFPLFVENKLFCDKSSWKDVSELDEDQIKKVNYANLKSHEDIMDWWKTKGKTKNLKDLVFVN